MFKIAAMQLGKVPTTREEINTMVLVPSLGLRVERFVSEDELFKFIKDYESEFILNGAIIHLLVHDAFIMVEKGMIVVSVRTGNSYRKILVSEFKNAIQMNRRKIRLYDELYDYVGNIQSDGLLGVVQTYLSCKNKNQVYPMKNIDLVLSYMRPSAIIQQLDAEFDCNDEVFSLGNGVIKSYYDIWDYMDKENIYYDEIIEYIVETENNLCNDGIRKILEGGN